MKKALIFASAAAALAVPAGAMAGEGWYGSLKAGYSVDGNLDVKAPVPAATATGAALPGGTYDFDNDWSGFGAMGYSFANNWRLEGELGYLDNDTDFAGGSASAWTLMANALYDIPLSERFKPYVGLGVGGLYVDSSLTTTVVPGGRTGFSDENITLGGQAMAGVGIGLTEQLALDVGYKYISSLDKLQFSSLSGTGTTGVGGHYKADYENQVVTVGLRWQFAAPPPPPAPPAPPPPPPPPPAPVAESCPTAQFEVYFEFNKSNLTPEANAVLDRAVADAAKCNYKTVTVAGNTDTSGSPQYNQGLSSSRAQIVADGLTARGVSAGLISQEANGESKPAVATQDGVKEPLNRRTEVVITFQ